MRFFALTKGSLMVKHRLKCLKCRTLDALSCLHHLVCRQILFSNRCLDVVIMQKMLTLICNTEITIPTSTILQFSCITTVHMSMAEGMSTQPKISKHNPFLPILNPKGTYLSKVKNLYNLHQKSL
jgi:hypothetical protein